MLYVTTRVSQDAFTSHRALTENRCPEGGFFVPVHLPHFDQTQISELSDRTFSQNLARILNLFFGTNLDGRELEFGIGRYPVKPFSLNRRITVAELWHNPAYRFERLVQGVERTIRQTDQISDSPSDWLQIASRIGVLFGLYGQFLHAHVLEAVQPVDIALPSANMSSVMSAWYARSMGLPIGNIIICCNENSGLWNLFHKGELRTDMPAVHTHTSRCDHTVPDGLERLIFASLGRRETERFCEISRTGGIYTLDAEQMNRLRDGICIRVVGTKRMASTIPNLYKTTGYVADPYTALAYSGLIDHRAAGGENRHALILAEESPRFSLDLIAACMNISAAEVKLLLK